MEVYPIRFALYLSGAKKKAKDRCGFASRMEEVNKLRFFRFQPRLLFKTTRIKRTAAMPAATGIKFEVFSQLISPIHHLAVVVVEAWVVVIVGGGGGFTISKLA